MAATGCPVHEGFDPLAPEFLADPYAVLAGLPLREAPLFYAPSIGYYVLTRHADIEQVFRDPATFSAAVAQAPLVPLVPEAAADPAGRRAPAAAVDGQPGRAGARPAAQARGARVQHDPDPGDDPGDRGDHGATARRGGRAGGVRPGRGAGVPAARQHRVLPDGRARTGLPAAQAVVRVPGGARLGPPGARRPGGDRHQHGRVPALPARPGGPAGRPAGRRPDQRPAGHPPRGLRTGSPARRSPPSCSRCRSPGTRPPPA